MVGIALVLGEKYAPSRPVALLVSRDGMYPPGSPFAAMDYQIPYLKAILGFMGLGPFHEIIAEPMGFLGPQVAKENLEKAVAEASELAKTL